MLLKELINPDIVHTIKLITMLLGVKRNTTKYTSAQMNQVSLTKDGILYKVFRGDQTGESIKKFREETDRIIQDLKVQKKKVLVLVNLSELGKTTLSARNEEIEAIRSLDFDKAAVYGQNFFNRKIAEIIVNVSGMEYKIKFFGGEDQAYEWLINSAV